MKRLPRWCTPAWLMVHKGLLVILCGAIVSWCADRSGYIVLGEGVGLAATWRGDDGAVLPLPFKLGLMDIVDGQEDIEFKLVAQCGEDSTVMSTSFFRAGEFKGYSFILRGIDSDGLYATLGVGYNYLGRNIVYCGYAALVLGMLGYAFRRRWQSSGGRIRAKSTEVFVAIGILFSVAFALVLRFKELESFPAAGAHDCLLLMSAVCCIACLLLRHSRSLMRIVLALGAVFAIIGLVLPAGNLGPGLRHPLLGLHVCLVMLAYSLLAILGVYASVSFIPGVLRFNVGLCTGLLVWGEAALICGVVCGSVWAADAWGRYWSWDPKETCALVTILVYALALHRRHLKFMQSRRAFRVYPVIAFGAVLFTWFGVSHFLGGLHS